MENIILIAVILVVICSASLYVYKAKKRGSSCIGCPHAKQCNSGKCSCASSQDTNSQE